MNARAAEKAARANAPRPRNRQSTAEAFTKSVVRNVGSRLATALVRGLLNSFKK
jgi:hypothetical protein